ncbi:MAG TPA: hypothetical protein VMB21_04625 [Candidatus Limnocylindria bacterium]|jgi:hypothetical protein|nr:hypothetical protein [Candidatus Limnocylindria bacterium]
MPLPKKVNWFRDLLSQGYFYDGLMAMGSGGLALQKALTPESDGKINWFGFYLALSVAILSLAKAIVAFLKRQKEREIHSLEGCLHTLQALLILGQPKEVELRVTIYVPESADKLAKLVDYVGELEERSKSNSAISAKCGVTGMAYRTKDACFLHRQDTDWETHSTILKKQYGYSAEEIKDLNPGKYSFLAIPMIVQTDGKKVEAVLYLDTNVKDFFPQEKIQLVSCACAGIARFIRKRYTA